MALLQECGTFTSPATTGQQVVNLDPAIWGGEAPKVVLFFAAWRPIDEIAQHGVYSFGCAVSPSSQAGVAIQATDSAIAGASKTNRRHTNQKCITAITIENGALRIEAELVSFAANQFTLNYTTQEPGWDGLNCNFLALGGDDLQGVKLDQITSPATPGEVSYTGVGFKPDALIAFGITSGTTPPATAAVASFHIGLSDFRTDRGMHFISSDNNNPSNTNRLSAGKFVVMSDGAVSNPQWTDSAIVKSADADGFTLDWDNADGSQRPVWVLALKGPQVKVGTFDTPTAPSTVSVAPGFNAGSGLLLSAMAPASVNVEADARIGIGAFDKSGGNAFSGAVDQDNISPTNADRVQRSDRALALIDHIQLYTDVATATPNGANVDFAFDAADATQRQVSYLMFGDAPTPKTTLAECGTFASPATIGQQTINLDPAIWGGEAPKVVLFWGCSVGAEGFAVYASQVFGCGVSSTARAAVAVESADNANPSRTQRRHTNVKCITRINDLGSTVYEADYVGGGANQFTIDWSQVNANYLINFLALGGDGLSDVYLDEITDPNNATSSQQVSYTGVGFEPDALIAFSISDGSNTPPATLTSAILSVGCSNLTNEYCSTFSSADNVQPSNTGRLQKPCLYTRIWSISLETAIGTADVASLDADGYTLQWDLDGGTYWPNNTIFVLCLKGPNVSVGTFNTPTAPGPVNVSPGFPVGSGLLLTAMGATSAAVEQEARIGIGAFDAANNNAFSGAVDEDDVLPTDADRVQRSDRALALIDHQQQYTDVATGQVSGNDVTFNFDTADATQREIAYLMFSGTVGAQLDRLPHPLAARMHPLAGTKHPSKVDVIQPPGS